MEYSRSYTIMQSRVKHVHKNIAALNLQRNQYRLFQSMKDLSSNTCLYLPQRASGRERIAQCILQFLQ
jgi:hypothetical protein